MTSSETGLVYDMYVQPVGEGFAADNGGLGHSADLGFEITQPKTEEGRERAQALLHNYFSGRASGVTLESVTPGE